MSKIDWRVLSGPYVSRRTMIKFGMAAGAVPFASWLAACGGDDDDDDDGGGSEDTDSGGDATEAPAGDATEAPADDATEAPSTDATESGGDEGGEDEEEEPTESSSGQVSGTAEANTPTPQEDAAQGGTLTLGFGQLSQILTLDPAQVTQGIVAGELVANLFSSLVQFDENLGIVADLAETWEVTEDGTGYTFSLREGLTFHNGDPLIASDFVYTYERTTDEAFASPHANKLALVTDIQAVDDLTLTITLSAPFAPFLAVACTRGPGRALTPIPKRAIDEMGDEQFGLTPVGCGPFMMVPESREVGQGFEMVAFEDWYAGRPLLDSIVVQVIPEPSSQASALEAGDIDMMNIIDTATVEQIRSVEDITFIEAPGTNWSGLMMNYARPPWDNPTARMAVAKAIDRQEYINTAFFGLGTASHSAIAPAFGWVYHAEDDDNPQAFNLDEAKALAEEAGISGTTVNIMALSDDPRAIETLRTILSEIGLELEIDPLQSAALNERWQAGDFDMHVNGSVVDADPDDGHWNFFHSEGPWNTYGFNNPQVDELLERTRTTNGVEERAAVWLELEQLLQEEVAYAFLEHTPDFTAFHNYVKGYRTIPEMRYMETVWIEE